MPDGRALEVLVADDLLRREAGRTRTTRRWQAAMARAAACLQQEAAPWSYFAGTLQVLMPTSR